MKLTKSEEQVYNYLQKFCDNQLEEGIKNIGTSTMQIATDLEMQRTNVSAALNKLYDAGKIVKIKGRPIIYAVDNKRADGQSQIVGNNFKFDYLIGNEQSLKKSIQQAKAAILYPPRGLHTLLVGETGVGKTMFAELMYKFGIESGVFKPMSPFISFNCADYANNPQLLLANLFGSKKGSYTGATKDEVGVVERANGGILFLDEVHRLPPEGQEMLFYLMDKGLYSKLGDAANRNHSEVLIICATTEDVGTNLLGTFTRRIPMCVDIPSLSERTLEERMSFITEFFKLESKRIGKQIVVSPNTIKALLLYKCGGNIGQLKGDIKLGCANAFLKFVSNKTKQVEVFSTDFPHYVRQGLINLKCNEANVAKVFKDDCRLVIKPKGKEILLGESEESISVNFYDQLEKRTEELEKRGLESDDINYILSTEIENHFKRYIGKVDSTINKKELSKIVSNKLITIVEKFLNQASENLGRHYDNQIYYGLALHIQSTMERIKNNKRIQEHSIGDIKEKYSDEYELAKGFCEELEEVFKVSMPENEIGFVAMFLILDNQRSNGKDERPIVVLAMHGKSTASSMADVANKLLGEDVVIAYDMPLDKKSSDVYEELKTLIEENERGYGALLLVDMGSLAMFGELITDDTGIEIKTLDMVSTPIVIECGRKALIEKDISNLWFEVKEYTPTFMGSKDLFSKEDLNKRNNIIVTICTTGEGSAMKLKSFMEGKYKLNNYDVSIIPLSMNDKGELEITLKKLRKDRNVIAIVGSFNPGVKSIPFISISEVFSAFDDDNLRKVLKTIPKVEGLYEDIFEMLGKENNTVDINIFKNEIMQFLNNTKDKLKVDLSHDMTIGLIMHIYSSLERLIRHDEVKKCFIKEEVMDKYSNEINILSKLLKEMEKAFDIKFSDDEKVFILRIILCL